MPGVCVCVWSGPGHGGEVAVGGRGIDGAEYSRRHPPVTGALSACVLLSLCVCGLKSIVCVLLLPRVCGLGLDQGMVEKWLLEVEETMVLSIRDVILQSVAAYAATPRKQWVIEWPGQVAICVSCIYWTAEVTDAMTLPHGMQVQPLAPRYTQPAWAATGAEFIIIIIIINRFV